jgi:minor extracellular serine protease Vpr
VTVGTSKGRRVEKRSFHGKGALVVLALLSLTTVVFSGSATGGTAAGGPERFAPVFEEDIKTSQYTPLGLQRGPVTVMVEVEGATVAEALETRELTDAEKQQIANELKAKQSTLKGSIEALGGTVVGDFQFAYNGIKVEIARDRTAELAKLPGVVGVHAVTPIERDNLNGVPLIAAPTVWGGVPGFRGEGMKIAIIDTGIDYTHANFGGPGTPEAFDAADATDTAPADPALFGPDAETKVKGGTDLVGDDYDAGDPAHDTPAPDPNPLDCNGHGSHVAGTAAGYGVLADGSTYEGPWDASTIGANDWTIGPGVAPLADLYAVRVFGCAGSTDVTVEAIEWSVANDMDVINMSLGSPFGRGDDPSAVASTNAVKAGVVVVASAGNSGPAQYITGSPAAGNGAISVAANDPIAEFPAATLALSTGETITAINANGQEFSPTTYNVVRIFDNPATPTVDESLGCNVSDYGTLPASALAVVFRGVCARVGKAIRGQQAGAAAVAMVNNAAGYPPFEGKITIHPDTGEEFTVTIPFFGVRGGNPPPPTSDGAKLYAAHGGTALATPTTLANPGYKAFASFTSGGPRNGDSWLKPDVTAPGVSISSTLVGSGAQAQILSGTSMAAPHVAGMAALVKQAHPRWKTEDLKAAIVNTGDPSGVTDFRISRGGTGLVHAPSATETEAVAIGDPKTGSLSYGFEELGTDYSKTRDLTVRNLSGSAIIFDVSQALATGSPHSVSFSASSLTVPAGGEATLVVTLNVPAATVGNSAAFREVGGLVMLTPQGGANNGVALKVPYYLVPRALSDNVTRVQPRFLRPGQSATATVRNRGVITGSADFYAWGLEDPKDGDDRASNDVRSMGVQSFPSPIPADPNRRLLVFALNTTYRWSNAAVNEHDIFVDVDQDGTDDYVVVGVDLGAITAGSFNGQMAVAVFSTRSAGASIVFLATAPTDSSTALLPVRSSQLCRTGEPCLSMSGNPRFTYHAVSFDLEFGGVDEVNGTAEFNAWTSSISQGAFLTVPPNGEASTEISINPTEWALTPAKGIMVVTMDNKAGIQEADTIEMGLR